MDVQSSVRERYSNAARKKEPALCCPAQDYDPGRLALLPREIIEKDYGCGDPSRHVRAGDVVLDLGSGAGKICYLAAQLVGTTGQVIGVDMNDDMLSLARKYQPEMAHKLGGDRVRFVKGRIQDLAQDLEALDTYLEHHPVRSAADHDRLLAWQEEQRRNAPLIADLSVDLVVSSCVLNLVREQDKEALIREIHRVLRPGGRVAVSDIVSDEPVPEHLKQDPELWSGCISGAYSEHGFLQAFADAGFLAVRYEQWDGAPWQVVEGIEFRSVTLTAVKGDGTACLDHGHAVLYRGPYASITDDEGHVFPRGERMAVCARTYRFLTTGPLRDDFIGIPPVTPRDPPVSWCAPPGTRRPAAESKGAAHSAGGETAGRCC
ncbi:MAG: methyltransferase [Chromatiales bacterium 21-64-14]|nr:MAG: methyltransferase [Chromatiales bacterium 21-64-14]HQU17135.1 methyltransferase domain-containing protein [Gammaproteobacteria bacterium]